jgi:hypothetical protein
MPMDYSGDEGNEGTRDWKPRANRVVEELSAQDSSNDDDKGDLGEYLTGPVMEATSARSWGGGEAGGPLNLRRTCSPMHTNQRTYLRRSLLRLQVPTT